VVDHRVVVAAAAADDVAAAAAPKAENSHSAFSAAWKLAAAERPLAVEAVAARWAAAARKWVETNRPCLDRIPTTRRRAGATLRCRPGGAWP